MAHEESTPEKLSHGTLVHPAVPLTSGLGNFCTRKYGARMPRAKTCELYIPNFLSREPAYLRLAYEKFAHEELVHGKLAHGKLANGKVTHHKVTLRRVLQADT